MITLHKVYLNKGLFEPFLETKTLTVSFSTFADKNDEKILDAKVLFNGKEYSCEENRVTITDLTLKPFSTYELTVTITGKENKDSKTVCVHTGNFEEKLVGEWITHPTYKFTEKRISPKVLSFRKTFNPSKALKKVVVYASALGIYDFYLNGEKVNNEYFLPGFTSYKHQTMYQRFDVTSKLVEENEIRFEVAGGWAVGSYVFTRANRITTDKQALFAEIHIEYEDGSSEIIPTDTSWETAINEKYSYADFYDGEGYDANDKAFTFVKAGKAKIGFIPNLVPHYGTYNRLLGVLSGELVNKEKHIYDFGQNHAGVVTIAFNGKKSQFIKIRHAEILTSNGDLNTSFLRTAKQEIIYVAKDGYQEYTPTFTYMGYRYIQIEGIDPEDVKVSSNVLSADIECTGSFKTSNEQLNRLQENILWSSRSNFVEIPTDCPQRDERMGWTGDIAVFAQTALDNFDVELFLDKWLRDLRSEQLKTGGIPNTIPSQSYGFPTTMPKMAIDFWGDAALLVPYAIYEKTGELEILSKSYESMKKYVDASKYWASFLSLGKNRYIWHTPSLFHFGDWVAPDAPKMSEWQGRSIYTATCSLKNTSTLLSKISGLLGNKENEEKYKKISSKTSEAFEWRLTDGNGKSKKEFQTAYVLPIYYDMYAKESSKENAIDNLVRLVEKNNYCIGTGFPGTPYILYSLFDNHREVTALKMLLNDKCPSWLYEAKVGGTTIWERWDGLDENGQCSIKEDGTGGMISYNHYASGAVGDFFYKRLAGITPIKPGYKEVSIKPYLNKDFLTSLEAKMECTYGEIKLSYVIKDNTATINVSIPVGVEAIVSLDNEYRISNGNFKFKINL